MEEEIREDRIAANREMKQRHRDWLAKRDLTWLIDHLVDNGPQSEVALSHWLMDQNLEMEDFSRRIADVHMGLESLWRIGKVWRKKNGIHPGTGYPSYVYGIKRVHSSNIESTDLPK
jgi:hypothetical protein